MRPFQPRFALYLNSTSLLLLLLYLNINETTSYIPPSAAVRHPRGATINNYNGRWRDCRECSVLVGVVLTSFLALVAVGSGGVHPDYLLQQDWSKVPSTIPVLYIALVFHNVVPVVTTQLEGVRWIGRLTRKKKR